MLLEILHTPHSLLWWNFLWKTGNYKLDHIFSNSAAKKLGLQRMRSLINVPGGLVVAEIYSQVHVIGVELERMNPKLYVDICKQVSEFSFLPMSKKVEKSSRKQLILSMRYFYWEWREYQVGLKYQALNAHGSIKGYYLEWYYSFFTLLGGRR